MIIKIEKNTTKHIEKITNNMKKTAFMIVYNDVDYVDYAIQSVIDWVDELVVVEGAFEITMNTGKPPRSNDGTLDILTKWSLHPKVVLKQANLREHKDHYDIGYQHAIGNGSDWAIMIDSDEVWTKPAQLMMNAVMRSQLHSPAFECRIQEYCFINDFNHWYQGTYPRLFKATPGSKFVYDNEVQFANRKRGDHSVYLLQSTPIFHYGYVRRRKRWEMKQEYMWEKDHNPSIKKDYGLVENTYIIPKDLPIYEFIGEHPDIMKNHPFFGKSAQDIIYG